MKYLQVLELIESFMIKSGFRHHCREVCHGGCCGSCSKRNDGKDFPQKCRNIGCSSAICDRRVSWGCKGIIKLPDKDLKLYVVAQKHLEEVLIKNGNSWWHTERTHIDESLEFDESKLEFFKSHITFKEEIHVARY